MSGRILLDRSIVEGILWRQPRKLRFWIYLLMSAKFRDTRIGGVEVKRGQWLRSVRKMSEDLETDEGSIPIGTIHRWLKDFAGKERRITTEPTRFGLLITILNYEKYQNFNSGGTLSGTPSGTPDEEENPLPNSELSIYPGEGMEHPLEHPVEQEWNTSGTIITNRTKGTKEEVPIVGQSTPDFIRQVIEYLNERTGKKYLPTSADAKKYIPARRKEGYELDDFKAAIDNQTNCWLGTDAEKYLRPSTLFNSDKFSGYVNNTNSAGGSMPREDRQPVTFNQARMNNLEESLKNSIEGAKNGEDGLDFIFGPNDRARDQLPDGDK